MTMMMMLTIIKILPSHENTCLCRFNFLAFSCCRGKLCPGKRRKKGEGEVKHDDNHDNEVDDDDHEDDDDDDDHEDEKVK